MGVRDSSESVDLSVVWWVAKVLFPCSKLSIVEFRSRRGREIEVWSVNVSFRDIREKINWWVGHKTGILSPIGQLS